MKSLLILLLIIPSILPAQVFYNDAELTIDGAILSVGDSVVNKGILLNNGHVIVRGGWMNGGNYSPDGLGEAIFDGSGLQVIDHERQSFNKLVIRGGGKKVFSTDITVKNLELDQGLLVSRNDSKIILVGSGLVTGGSDASHILGSVEHQGAGNWIFPLGNGKTYLPAVIFGVSDPTAIGLMVENDFQSGQLMPSSSIETISNLRYWSFMLESGTLAGSRISLALRGDSYLPDDPARFVVAEASSLPGPFSSLGHFSVEGDRQSGQVTSEDQPFTGFYAVGSLFDEASGLFVHNAVSPNGDEKNELMYIDNIENYPNNIVTIFNRWGDKVFVMSHYDNNSHSFRGEGNVNNSTILPPAAYFYSIETVPGGEKITGFLQIR